MFTRSALQLLPDEGDEMLDLAFELPPAQRGPWVASAAAGIETISAPTATGSARSDSLGFGLGCGAVCRFGRALKSSFKKCSSAVAT